MSRSLLFQFYLHAGELLQRGHGVAITPMKRQMNLRRYWRVRRPGHALTYRLVLIDDHPVVAVGLRLALHSSPFELVATATDPSTGASVIEQHRPDALLVDLVFGGTINLPLIRLARKTCPTAVVIVFSSLHEVLYARQALDAGADAFLNKSIDLSTVVARLTDLVTKAHASHQASPEATQCPARLTRRETEIARYLSRGSPIGAIA